MNTLLELLVLTLFLGVAGYRVTQLVVHDTIADPPRDRILDWHSRHPESTPRTLIATLISCTYCTGWWVSGALLATYLTATSTWNDVPLLVHGITWFAISGVQALLNRWDDTRKDGQA